MGKGEPQDNNIETESTTLSEMRLLPCILSAEEKQAFGSELAHTFTVRGNIETAMKESRDEFKAKISECDTQINSLSSCIESGKQDREIECKVKLDAYLGTAKITRTDTGEVVDERPMRPSEYQRKLF